MTRHKRFRPLSVASLLAAVGLLACSRDEPPEPAEPPREKPALPLSAAPALPSAPAPRPPSSAAALAIAEVRKRALSLAAPDAAPPRLAFGRGFLVQARSDGVRLLDSTSGAELASVPLREPRAVAPMPWGSVLAVGLDESLRLDPGGRVLRGLTRLSLLPGAEVLPSLETLERVWIVDRRARSLQRVALSADAGLGLEAQAEVPEFDGRAFTMLRDGSWAFSSGNGLLVRSSGGRTRSFALPTPPGGIWRMLPAPRIDQVWLVTETGDLVLVELGERARVVRTVATGLVPFAVAATPTRLAFVSVSPPPQDPRRFFLHVYTPLGERVFTDELASAAMTAHSDWVESVLRERHLTLGGEPLRIAVGGADSVRVYDAVAGTRLFGD